MFFNVLFELLISLYSLDLPIFDGAFTLFINCTYSFKNIFNIQQTHHSHPYNNFLIFFWSDSHSHINIIVTEQIDTTEANQMDANICVILTE